MVVVYSSEVCKHVNICESNHMDIQIYMGILRFQQVTSLETMEHPKGKEDTDS